MSGREAIKGQIQRMIEKENTLNTVIRNIENYKVNLNGLTTNLNSINESIKGFFSDKSVCFKPSLDYYDEMKVIIAGYKNHLNYLRGYESKVIQAKTVFERIRKENTQLMADYKSFEHYEVKLKKLKKEKEKAERNGKSLSNKKITRIIRNETKFSNSRNRFVDTLKDLSVTCKKAEKQASDIICPLLSSIASALYKLNRSHINCSKRLNDISPKFQKPEKSKKIYQDVFKEVINIDPKFDSDREILLKEYGNKSSFLEYYNKRAENQPDSDKFIDSIKEEVSDLEMDRSATDRNLLPLMTIGTISNRSGTFLSPGVSIRHEKGNMIQKSDKNDFDDDVGVNKLKNPPLKSPSKSGRESEISVEVSDIKFSEYNSIKQRHGRPPSSALGQKKPVTSRFNQNDNAKNNSSFSLDLDDFMSESIKSISMADKKVTKRSDLRDSFGSSVNGFSFGEKSNFKKKSFNGVAVG